MLSREQLSTATAWGLDAAVSLKLTIPARAMGCRIESPPLPEEMGDTADNRELDWL